ncbi:MAG: carotenoid biosynthesis protein [Raineya sp.]|nr:carotenoid biosynthesis protein [Raineya sp.]
MTISLNEKTAIFLLLAMHIAGILGLVWEVTRPIFLSLVPFNLLANAALMLYFHKNLTKQFGLVCLIVMLGGFGVELLGVQTHAIFGAYWYETTLGIKFWGVPLLIAVNWLIVIYTSQAVASLFGLQIWGHILLATLLTVGLDVLIEPVAIRFDFWDWAGGKVPLQNYVGWAGTAFVLHCIFAFTRSFQKNKVAIALYACEVLFFVMLQIL